MGCCSVSHQGETSEPIIMKQKVLKLKTSSTQPDEIKKKIFRNKDGQLFHIIEIENKLQQVPLLDQLESNRILIRRKQTRTQSEQLC